MNPVFSSGGIPPVRTLRLRVISGWAPFLALVVLAAWGARSDAGQERAPRHPPEPFRVFVDASDPADAALKAFSKKQYRWFGNGWSDGGNGSAWPSPPRRRTSLFASSTTGPGGSGIPRTAGMTRCRECGLTACGETHVSAETGEAVGVRLTRRVREEPPPGELARAYFDRNATQNAAKRSGSAGMDRRSNAAWVLPQAVNRGRAYHFVDAVVWGGGVSVKLSGLDEGHWNGGSGLRNAAGQLAKELERFCKDNYGPLRQLRTETRPDEPGDGGAAPRSHNASPSRD